MPSRCLFSVYNTLKMHAMGLLLFPSSPSSRIPMDQIMHRGFHEGGAFGFALTSRARLLREDALDMTSPEQRGLQQQGKHARGKLQKWGGGLNLLSVCGRYKGMLLSAKADMCLSPLLPPSLSIVFPSQQSICLARRPKITK